MFARFRRKINAPPDRFRSELIELMHFIKTPLASIKIGSDILKDVSPALIEAYKKQTPSADGQACINDKKMEKLVQVIDSILTEANRISKYIEKIELK